MSGAIIAWPLKLADPDTETLLAGAHLVRDIGRREMGECDREAGIDHGGRQVGLADAAGRDSAAIIVDISLLASHALAGDKAREPVRRRSTARPGSAIAVTALGECGRVDAVKTDGNAGEAQRVAVRCARRAADILCKRRRKKRAAGDKENRLQEAGWSHLPPIITGSAFPGRRRRHRSDPRRLRSR